MLCITPNAPREITAPRKSSPSDLRESFTRSPAAVTISSGDAVATRRLFEAVQTAIGDVAANHRTLPMDFSYQESVATANGRPLRQRVLLTLWDSPSLWDRARELGYKVAKYSKIQYARKNQAGRFSPRPAPATMCSIVASSPWVILRGRSPSGFWTSMSTTSSLATLTLLR